MLCFIVSTFQLFNLLVSCDDYDSFTTDRSTTLTFSTDSVVFDTLVATIPSATQTLTVYNRADDGLRISELWIEAGAGSRFRVNVDGQDLTAAEERRARDFEVRRRDSIIVRIEVTLPTSDTDSAVTVTDALHFRLESGIEQQVVLQATAIDGIFMHGLTISSDTLFNSPRPYIIYDSLVVAPEATLTLAAATHLFFHHEAGLTVHGRLIANGTTEAPVHMRTDRTDRIFPYLPYDRLPSRWQGLRFTSESTGNELHCVDIRGGSYGIICDSTGTDDLKLTLTNSRIHDLGGDGLSITDCRCIVANSEISNTLGHCVKLRGGDVRFTLCTLAQFYSLSAARGDALNIANIDLDVYHPLYGATFESCVITGYAEDVVMGAWLNADSLSTEEAAIIGTPKEEFMFDHCFLATEIPTEGDYANRFVACVYDDPDAEIHNDKNFTLIDYHALLYDFTPVELSPIRGCASPELCAEWPTDLRGRSRTANEAGCYAGEVEKVKE